MINEDLRIIKTERALCEAIYSLLKKQNFKKTTVKEICEEALISRAAFYAHFIDKYDLLEQWLTKLWMKHFNCENTYEQFEQTVNGHIHKNSIVLKNLMCGADDETFNIIFNFILSAKSLKVEKNSSEKCKMVVISNFYAGGIISYVMWQIKNEFPSCVPLMNKDIYQMLSRFQSIQS